MLGLPTFAFVFQGSPFSLSSLDYKADSPDVKRTSSVGYFSADSAEVRTALNQKPTMPNVLLDTALIKESPNLPQPMDMNDADDGYKIESVGNIEDMGMNDQSESSLFCSLVSLSALAPLPPLFLFLPVTPVPSWCVSSAARFANCRS